MKSKGLWVTLAGAALMSTGLITTAVEPNIFNVNSNENTVQAAVRFRIKLRHNSAYYNMRGKRIGKKYSKKNAILTAYGMRTIKHRRYYNIGRGRYLKATNAYRLTNKKNFRRLRNGNYEFRILIRSAVYNAKGRRLNLNYISKGSYVYGKRIVTIKGVQFVDIGYGQYIKRANTRTFFVRGHGQNNSGRVINSSHRSSTNHKGTKPKNNHHSSKPTKSNTGNTKHNNTGSSSGKTNRNNSENGNSNNHVHAPTVGDNDLNHVNELVVEKLNAIRANTPQDASLGNNPAFKLRPYKTNSEMQTLANLRAKEYTITHAHTRPDGSRMDANEYKKLIPNTVGKWHGAVSLFGEALSGVSAQKTDEEMADKIINAAFWDTDHHDILIGANVPYAYVAVGFYWVSSAKSYSVAFELVGDTRPPFEGNDWK